MLSSDPSMERDYSVSGIKEFAYDTTIPPGQTRTVRFKLRAMKAGEFTGGIGAYVGDLSQEVFPAITFLP